MAWACGNCTFLNEADSISVCTICETRREGVAPKRPKHGGKQVTLFGHIVNSHKVPKHSHKAPPSHGMERKKSAVMERPQFHLSIDQLKAKANEILIRDFGHSELRGLQTQAVDCFLRRQSQIVVMATSGGKSLCYQLPALTLGGTTIVVSPLKALIADQVESLLKKGIPAAFLSSSLTEAEKTNVMERVLQRSLRSRSKPVDFVSWKGKFVNLLYCTPELLQTDRFRHSLQELYKSNRLTGFAIDEAHCLSQWGHDFRPAYLKLDYLRVTYPDLPLMACTATAPPQVLSDIRRFLRLQDRPCHLGSFDRKNIFYKVRYKDLIDTNSSTGATGDMVNFIKKRHEMAKKDGSKCNGIVYVHRQKDTVELAQIIHQQTGIRTEGYHGGMKDTDRTRIQEAWTSGEAPIAIATVAFGMGIDLAHVRYVIHWSMAKTIEGFYQESGRAGRDGKPCYSLLYFSKRDVSTFEYLARNKQSKQKGANIHALEALEKMVDYCTKPGCRRQYLLKFFGEKYTDPKTVCRKSCDFCQNPSKVTKAIEAASCANDFTFHSSVEQQWDGQWSNPHGDEDIDDDNFDDEKVQLAKSQGLSLTGEDSESSFVHSFPRSRGSARAGFSKASDILAGYEALEKRDMGDIESRKRKERPPVIPEHFRNMAPDPLASFDIIVPVKSSTSHEAEAARLRAELEKMKAAREALAKSNLSKTADRKAPPPPPPVVFSQKKRRY